MVLLNCPIVIAALLVIILAPGTPSHKNLDDRTKTLENKSRDMRDGVGRLERIMQDRFSRLEKRIDELEKNEEKTE